MPPIRGRPGKRSPEEHRRELMRTAKAKAENKFTAGGKERKRAPVTLPKLKSLETDDAV